MFITREHATVGKISVRLFDGEDSRGSGDPVERAGVKRYMGHTSPLGRMID